MSNSNATKPLNFFRVSLKEEPGDKHQIIFECHAEDEDHAFDQAQNAYPAACLEDMNCVNIGDVDPDYWRKSLVPGSGVFWNDPGCGISSGDYILKRIFGEIYSLANDAGSEVEALIHELEPSAPEGLLEVVFDEEVLGQATSAEQAIAIVGEYKPDVDVETHQGSEEEVVIGGHTRNAWVVREMPVRLQLVLDVSYIPNGVRAIDLRDNLLDMVQHAIGSGLLTGDGPAEVTTYDTAIQRAPEPLSEDDLAAFMLQRIEDGDLTAADMPTRLAKYGLMNPVDFQLEMQERIANATAGS